MSEKGSSESGFLSVREPEQEGLSGRLFEPLGPEPAPGVLVLHGGEKGVYTLEYAEHLAHHGFAALRLEYFDAPGLSDELVEIPLSYFERAVDWLVDQNGVSADRAGSWRGHGGARPRSSSLTPTTGSRRRLDTSRQPTPSPG